jgi:hypothetical protein
MIAVCYTGDKRHNYSLTLTNHQKLFDKLSELEKIKVYWFTKDTSDRGVCPYDDNSSDQSHQGKYRLGQGGAIQTWDFVNAISKVKENIIIRMRTDTWFHDTAIEVIFNEVKEVLDGRTDIAFFGSDLINDNVGKEFEKIFVNPHHVNRIQDFIIVTDKRKIYSPIDVIKIIDETHPKKRGNGNKTFRYCIPNESKAYTILCKIYLIRKFYEAEPAELDIFEDYLKSYGAPEKFENLIPAYTYLRKQRKSGL